MHSCFHPCASSRARTRTEKCSANDSWGMHLGCNCDSEVACFPKGCLFSLPLCHLYPSVPRASSLFGSFLAVHRENLWTIRSERERTGRAGAWFDKSLLVKRLPDCRERDERRGGGCDLRPMVEFLSDADCSRLLWMVIAGSPSSEGERLQDAVDREKKSRPIL